MSEAADDFYQTLPAFTDFEGVTDPANYRPLPQDWLLATSDIVGSTKAIAAGRYKAVNMAGASVISAVLNALKGHHAFPFVFGGDGAMVAIPASAEAATRTALAAVQTWVAEELGLVIRAAVVPVAEIRRNGHDVRVARFAVAPEVAYAMFSGGGASWAESQMKAGRFVQPPAARGTRPDLTGLSCRWNPVTSRHGEILSIIAIPGPKATARAFDALVARVVALTGQEERGGHPFPEEGPATRFKPGNLDFEARAAGRAAARPLRKLGILAQVWLVAALDRLKLPLGRFDAGVYRRDVAQNSDFRKFDDGLKMTVDVDLARARQIEALLEEAERGGICRFGLHRQESAIMTCLVPTPLQRDHMHFIDGGSGGYAMAATRLKALA
ncbi:MAG: DUF3095 domain-containing protein [Hyphomicrobiales bacterium]